ncbi:MAG TPA: formylglycine-generating enzyme family protein, partial [Edaphobacter sp.]
MKQWSMGWLLAGVLMSAPLTACRSSTHKEKTNPLDKLVYVWVPGGSYYTGCTPEDQECMGRERHRQLVVINLGFWIGKTEVTQAAFKRVMGTNPSRYPGAQHPVEQVDWQSARTYCSRVEMRLPTESEWEFAAGGGVDAPRYGPIEAIAWYDPNSGDSTHDVGGKQPNAYGLYDMLGNVWEWVEDPSNVDPHRKIVKGGSFYNISRDIR